MSTTVTFICGHCIAMTLHVGPPTYPAPIQHIFVTAMVLCAKNVKTEKMYYIIIILTFIKSNVISIVLNTSTLQNHYFNQWTVVYF